MEYHQREDYSVSLEPCRQPETVSLYFQLGTLGFA